MANYGESLCSWYLRLNGFFPVSNFVLHKFEELEHSADCDVLALRPPNVYEEIGGQVEDWDPALTEFCDFSSWQGIIAEVKTGRFDEIKLELEPRLRYAVRRFGLEKIDQATGELLASPTSHAGPITIHKVLMTRDGDAHPRFHSIGLFHAADFLCARFERYREKNRDRVFFDSDLVQFLIAHVDRARGGV
jgi:hypothetical protein